MNQGANELPPIEKKEPNNAREPIKVSMLDETKFVIKAGEYAIATTGGVIDRVLLDASPLRGELEQESLLLFTPTKCPSASENQGIALVDQVRWRGGARVLREG